MIRWLATNLRTFLWALVMALAVWVAAVSASDPDEVRPYPNPIQIETVGQDPGLVGRQPPLQRRGPPGSHPRLRAQSAQDQGKTASVAVPATPDRRSPGKGGRTRTRTSARTARRFSS